MKTLTPQQMIDLIEDRGWYLYRQRGSHRVYRSLSDMSKMTVIPYHKHDLAPGTQRAIMRDVGLSPADLAAL